MGSQNAGDETTWLLKKDQERADLTLQGRDSGAVELGHGDDLTESIHPKFWPVWRKWAITIVYALLEAFVTMSTTMYVSAAYLVQEKFGASVQVTTLGQSMFVVGTALGPAFLGPFSDIGGRKWVYVISILTYAMMNVGAAMAVNLPMLIVFQFLCGFAGSTALSNVAGTIADLFGGADDAGQPMALFVAATNIGASMGSPIGTLIANNQYMGLAGIFWINVIVGCGFATVMVFVPETLPSLVLSRAVGGGGSLEPQLIIDEKPDSSVLREMYFVATMSVKIMFTEPIVTTLAICNGWLYGLLFLYLDGVIDVFVGNNSLSVLQADLTYLNFAVGAALMFVFFPVQTWLYRQDRRRNKDSSRPEARFLTSLVAVWLFPITLFWFALTSDGTVSFWSPVIAGTVLGFADPLVYSAMLSYITDCYPGVAASAVAAFIIPSFLVAAGCAHIGTVMFNSLGTTWAMAIIGILSFGVVGLVYIIYFFGPKLRKASSLAKVT